MPRLAECDVVGPRSFHPYAQKSMKNQKPNIFFFLLQSKTLWAFIGLISNKERYGPPEKEKEKKSKEIGQNWELSPFFKQYN